MDQQLSDAIVSRRAGGLQWWSNEFEEDGIWQFYPEVTQCCGVELRVKESSRNVQVYSFNFFASYPARSYVSHCPRCESNYFFDGRKYGILNFNHHYLIDVGSFRLTLELFYELLELKINAGVPTHAWWKVKVDMSLLRYGLQKSEVDRNRKLWMGLASRLTSFLYEYLRLIEIPDHLFGCCANPTVVSVDGTDFANVSGIVLSVKSKRIIEANLKHPWLDEHSIAHRATTRPLRAVIPLSATARKLMHAYSHDGASKEDYKALLTYVKEVSRDVWQLMVHSTPMSTTLPNLPTPLTRPIKCHPSLKSFFSGCSKPIFPAAHFLPPPCWSAVEEFVEHYGIPTSDMLTSFATHAPQLYQMLSYYHQLRQDSQIQQVSLELTVVQNFNCLHFEASETDIPRKHNSYNDPARS